jgi:hypothetical protein
MAAMASGHMARLFQIFPSAGGATRPNTEEVAQVSIPGPADFCQRRAR